MGEGRSVLGVGLVVLCAVVLSGCVAQIQPVGPGPGPAPRLVFEDLRITDLDVRPDPVQSGDRMRFLVTVANRSSYSERVRISILDRDELVAELPGVNIHPGTTRVEIPRSGYRFHRSDHCFVVEADIAGTRRSVDAARRFCARRVPGGWTLRP